MKALKTRHPSQERVPRGAHMVPPYFRLLNPFFASICPISTALGGRVSSCWSPFFFNLIFVATSHLLSRCVLATPIIIIIIIIGGGGLDGISLRLLLELCGCLRGCVCSRTTRGHGPVGFLMQFVHHVLEVKAVVWIGSGLGFGLQFR